MALKAGEELDNNFTGLAVWPSQSRQSAHDAKPDVRIRGVIPDVTHDVKHDLIPGVKHDVVPDARWTLFACRTLL